MANIAPQRRLTGDAPAEFIETRMDIPEGVIFSKEMDCFLPEVDVEEQEKKVEALWKATTEDRNNLFKAMQIYQDSIAKREPSEAKVDLRVCNWPEVVKEFEKAKESYKIERQKRATGPLTSCLRKFGKNADAFSMWISLLPNGDYGAGICGAFKLILGAISRMDKVRTSIYKGLEDIPEAVSKARRYREIYSDVKVYQLSQKTAVLFSSVLKALEKIIIVLTEPGWKRASKAFFKGDSYSDPIIESIKAVETHAIEIEKEAEICAGARLRKMDDDVVELKRSQQVTDLRIQHISHMVGDLYHNFLLSNPTINPHTRQPYPESRYHHLPAAAAKRRRKIKGATPQKAPLTIAQLLILLDYDNKVPAADINRCCLDGQQMSLSSKDRVAQIARSDHLRRWLLNAQESSSLIIMGNTSDPTAYISPLSFLVAVLARLYAETNSTAAVSYFCGLHVDSWKNPLANATGLINSLLGQLLEDEHFDFEVGFIDDELSKRVRSYDIWALCELFKTLVLQIKEMIMLLCFVDTISIYETSERQEGTTIVIEALRWLVEETARQRAEVKEGVVFKLMITDPGITCATMELFEEEEVFEVESYIDGGRQGVVVIEGLAPQLGAAE